MMSWLVHVLPAILLAQATSADTADSDMMGLNVLLRHLIAAVVFSLVGIAVLALCLWIIDQLTPFSFRKEILEDHNTALAILVGAGLIGIALIIAASVQG